MSCRGVLFATTDETVAALLAVPYDGDPTEILEEVEEAWEQPFVSETDQAWEAIHGALSDAILGGDGGEAPLHRAILGGQHLCKGDDYIGSFVQRAAEVGRAVVFTVDQ